VRCERLHEDDHRADAYRVHLIKTHDWKPERAKAQRDKAVTEESEAVCAVAQVCSDSPKAARLADFTNECPRSLSRAFFFLIAVPQTGSLLACSTVRLFVLNMVSRQSLRNRISQFCRGPTLVFIDAPNEVIVHDVRRKLPGIWWDGRIIDICFAGASRFPAEDNPIFLLVSRTLVSMKHGRDEVQNEQRTPGQIGNPCERMALDAPSV